MLLFSSATTSQATAWDAALRQRLPSVLHQDAITQIEMSTTCGSGSGAGSGSGGIRLAIAQANQCVRIVPYGVLRDAALEARSRRREAAEAVRAVAGDYEDHTQSAGKANGGGTGLASVGPMCGAKAIKSTQQGTVRQGAALARHLCTISAPCFPAGRRRQERPGALRRR